jgi:hypothetical protein
MESSLSISHTRTGPYDLWRRMSLSWFIGAMRDRKHYIGLAALKRSGVKALLLVDVLVGLWLAGTYIYVFHALSGGGTVGEPDAVIARTELWLSIGVTCWFLWQVPYWVLRLLKEPRTSRSTQTVGQGAQEKGD